MKVLKSFVRNRNRPEGCIAEAQVCEEVVQFCLDFLSGLDPIGLGSLNSRKDKQTDRSLTTGTYVHPDLQQFKQAHLHILQNTEEGIWLTDVLTTLSPVMKIELFKNSGIMLVATTMQVSSAKDKNSVIGDMSFYGIIEDIWKDVATPKEKEESSTQKRKRGPTEMKEITRARSEGQKLVIEYNELGQAIGQNAMKLKIIGTTVRFHIPITYSDWPKVPKKIKDKIFELIEAGFVVDPRSKKTIIQNVGKKSENGKEKRKKHKYNHRTSRKGYENLMEELKASSSDQIDRFIVWKQARMDRKGQIPDEETKEVDILTRALGGKNRLGILRDVRKYVTKKKYFHTATQQKTNEKEDENATSKEHDRMAKRIKELEDKLLKMKEKDDFLGDLKEEPESQKDVEDVVESNEEIKCVVDHEVLLKCFVDHEVLLKCVVDHEVLSKCCVVDKKVLLKCVVDYEVLLKCFVDHEVLLKCCVVHHEVNVMCLCG
ncbi:uncharacterized protein E5676_scaffold208G00510 [Cucumis melo var. makuwa]|uniref:DUF4218 domain-containing protein n=1 Tax=Cucumis melo var. makuwa TaxID=1194695 RepID=A0A5D3E159_CUCMM|nr:uncharacterized protein E5676_scaffold208G00510 [Cucumis melo var. makuwa]